MDDRPHAQESIQGCISTLCLCHVFPAHYIMLALLDGTIAVR